MIQIKAERPRTEDIARMDTISLIAKYDRAVPRYTSYPTAPHFSTAIDGGVYARWLRALPEDAALSLYLHVPFCASLCRFCACHTTVVNRPEPLELYGITLMAEIDLVADVIGGHRTVRHIHWGGGTPTQLPADTMLAVMRRLRARFDVAPDAEIAVEIDPRTLGDDSLTVLAAMGTNRVSLGVQDFDPNVQDAINRHQSLALTEDCATRLRSVGIDAINLDLIYGLPYQTTAGVIETVRQALGLKPSRAAVFGYAHVPWMKKHQALIPDASLPNTAERFAQRQAIEATFLAHGYTLIGLDHFALPDDALAQAAAGSRLRRNFQGYTTDAADVLIGLGASSIGAVPQGYIQNHPGVPAWRDAVRDGVLPIARGVALTDADRARRAIIEQLMCHLTANPFEIAADSGIDPADLADAEPALRNLETDGLLERDGHRVTVTGRGRPFVRTIAAAFDCYLARGTARHSVAV
jgi:oxygen-independent coproporphyrinogen-3 oxidase